jgi:hypothetical protein
MGAFGKTEILQCYKKDPSTNPVNNVEVVHFLSSN